MIKAPRNVLKKFLRPFFSQNQLGTFFCLADSQFTSIKCFYFGVQILPIKGERFGSDKIEHLSPTHNKGNFLNQQCK